MKIQLTLFIVLLLTLSKARDEDKETLDFFQKSASWEEVEKTLFLGSVNTYYSNDEINLLLTTYRTSMPQVVSGLVNIGKTIQGKDIYAVQLAVLSSGSGSTVPDTTIVTIDSFTNRYSDRPAILFTGMHDGNDPISMSMVLYILKRFIYAYAQNDQEYLYLLKTRQIWFVPAINRDAYQQMELDKTAFSFIKNMNTSTSCSTATLNGVNLKLNYKPVNGSTPLHDKCNILYEGSSAFSEPETQAIQALTEKIDFDIAINFFARNNTVLVPLNYLSRSDVTNSTLYKNSEDKDIFSEIFKKSGLTLSTFYGNNYGKRSIAVQGEVSDYLYNYKNIYSLSVELGYKDIANTVFPLSPLQNLEVWRYFYNMTFYSIYKLGKQIEWIQLYQLFETCMDQHLSYLNCKGDNIKVYSAKFQLQNYGLSAEEIINILITSVTELEIINISVQDEYSTLYNFNDTKFVDYNLPSDKYQVQADIFPRTPKYISIIGLYKSAQETPTGTITLSVVGELSYNNSQIFTAKLADYGGVKGFQKIVKDDEKQDDNIRQPSIILIIVYFVSLAVVFGLGLLVYGASKFSGPKTSKAL